MGKKENNYTVEVRVKVEDAYGMTASTIFHARVSSAGPMRANDLIMTSGSDVIFLGERLAEVTSVFDV